MYYVDSHPTMYGPIMSNLQDLRQEVLQVAHEYILMRTVNKELAKLKYARLGQTTSSVKQLRKSTF